MCSLTCESADDSITLSYSDCVCFDAIESQTSPSLQTGKSYVPAAVSQNKPNTKNSLGVNVPTQDRTKENRPHPQMTSYLPSLLQTCGSVHTHTHLHTHRWCFCSQDADGMGGQLLGVGLRSLKGSDRRGPCRRDSSVVRRMLLSESWWWNLFLRWRQHGRLRAKSDSRFPLKIM